LSERNPIVNEKDRKSLVKDIELMEKMTDKMTDVWNELQEWCDSNCPYNCSCRQFAGACSIQTLKSVANWGWRVMLDETTNQKKAKAKKE
jgi:hypothetical protein